MAKFGLVDRFRLDHLGAWFVVGEDSLPFEFGSKNELSYSEFSLTWHLARNPLSLVGVAFKTCMTEMPNYVLCDRARLLPQPTSPRALGLRQVVTVRIDPQQLVQIDVSYVTDNIDPPWIGLK